MTTYRTLPAWAAAAREYTQVVATTDVHSSLDRIGIVARSLARLRAGGAVIADCGDFFEGTGYYVLGRGRAETAILCGLYDVAGPGNHGYRHHLASPCLRLVTVCANVTDHSGALLWAPLAFARIRGRRTAITAVLGTEAFGSIPPADRCGHLVRDPVIALRALYRLHHDVADSWIVLSHSGFGHDLQLAAACPFIDVIFTGHCHSSRYGPEVAGGIVVVKGGELATGYAAAWPAAGRWDAEVRQFTDSASRPVALRADLTRTLAAVSRMRASLTRDLGPVRARFACRTPSRDELLGCLCTAAMHAAAADAALLNLTCLREARLNTVLRAGDLMTLEPFGNLLTTVTTPDVRTTAARLAAGVGPVAAVPGTLPPGTVRVVTTDYLAAAYLRGGPERPAGDGFAQPLRDLVAELLTGSTGQDGAGS